MCVWGRGGGGGGGGGGGWGVGVGEGLWDRIYMDHHVEDWLHMYTQLCTEAEIQKY